MSHTTYTYVHNNQRVVVRIDPAEGLNFSGAAPVFYLVTLMVDGKVQRASGLLSASSAVFTACVYWQDWQREAEGTKTDDLHY